MDLIVTHDSADFDALSSLVAASKLYPDSRLLLPGSQERSVRNFLALIKDEIRIENEKACRFDDVERLVIVDCHQRSRIGRAAELLDRENIVVHIYDHHPRSASDIKAAKDVRRNVGATVTVLLQEMERKKVGLGRLSPLEATLMLLGIYQETGSLSYTATTKRDVDMVSKLLDRGAKLRAVSAYLNRELSGEELAAFLDMLESLEVERIADLDVAFFKYDDTGFRGEAGSVVHKLRDVENYPVLFALFHNGSRVKIIARSRVAVVRVNELLAVFGGGGHQSAASARAQGLAIAEAKSIIMERLQEMVTPRVFAGEIMSAPVKSLSEDERVSRALEKLERWGHKGAPVTGADGKVKAMITQGDLQKAVMNGMEHSRIKGYMSRPLLTVGAGTSLRVLQDMIIEKDKGRIPVVEDGELVGIVTRTDILKKVHKGLFPGQESHLPKNRIKARMDGFLPDKVNQIIRLLGREADKRGVRAYLVGGFVRDLLLGRRDFDLDVVLEKDAIDFARELAAFLGLALVVHEKFGTASIVGPWPRELGEPPRPGAKFKIDIATARQEVYDRPAALPTVRYSSIRNDLYRRDFTINALAICINEKHFGTFLDFFGGVEDLENGIIRTLHDRSFIDDPTRVFRAVRFEKRFSFRIEEHTQYLIKHAIKARMFGRTEDQRIRDELIRMLDEPTALDAILRMKELNELRFIHPELRLMRTFKSTFERIPSEVAWYGEHASGKRELDIWVINFMILISGLSPAQAEEVVERFVFTKSVSIRIRRFSAESGTVLAELSKPGTMPPSVIWEKLIVFSHESILGMLVLTRSPRAKERIRDFLEKYNTVKLSIKGRDIKGQGIEPGPLYREILLAVLRKKLDGEADGREEQLALMRALLDKKLTERGGGQDVRKAQQGRGGL